MNIKEKSLFLHGILHQLIPQPSHCTYRATRLTNKYRATNLSGRNFVRITGAAGDKDRVLCLTHKAATWATDGVGAAHNGCRIRVAPCLHSKTAISPRYHVNKLETSRDWNLVILLHVIKTRYPVQKQHSALLYKQAVTAASSHVTHPLAFTKSKSSIIFGFSASYIGSLDRTVGIVTMLRAGHLTKLGSIPGMGKSFLISSVSIPALRPPILSHGNSGYIVRGVKLTIGVTWDVPGGEANDPPIFFLPKSFFFWVEEGQIKKIEIF